MPDASALAMDLRLGLASTELHIQVATEASSVAIVGPSGAGKSTVLRILAGVERRAQGVVRFQGEVWQDSASGGWVQPWSRGVGWVPQDVLLFPHLTVRENLTYGSGPEVDVQDVGALLQISALLDRRPARLSGGERQRVALGRALVSEPRLLLLDEPFSALDRSLRAEMASMVREWSGERGVCVVLVSHDDEDARTLGDARFRLSGGSLVQEA